MHLAINCSVPSTRVVSSASESPNSSGGPPVSSDEDSDEDSDDESDEESDDDPPEPPHAARLATTTNPSASEIRLCSVLWRLIVGLLVGPVPDTGCLMMLSTT
jgi:hypothetical protein